MLQSKNPSCRKTQRDRLDQQYCVICVDQSKFKNMWDCGLSSVDGLVLFEAISTAPIPSGVICKHPH